MALFIVFDVLLISLVLILLFFWLKNRTRKTNRKEPVEHPQEEVEESSEEKKLHIKAILNRESSSRH